MVCPCGKSGAKMRFLLTLFLSSWHAFPALDFDNHDEETLKGATPPYLWPIKVMLVNTPKVLNWSGTEKKRTKQIIWITYMDFRAPKLFYLLLFLSKCMINEVCIAPFFYSKKKSRFLWALPHLASWCILHPENTSFLSFFENKWKEAFIGSSLNSSDFKP